VEFGSIRSRFAGGIQGRIWSVLGCTVCGQRGQQGRQSAGKLCSCPGTQQKDDADYRHRNRPDASQAQKRRVLLLDFVLRLSLPAAVRECGCNFAVARNQGNLHFSAHLLCPPG